MGHSRLGWLLQTYRWQDVVALVADGGSAAAVADAMLDAAHRGLELAVRDRGLRQVFWLLTQVVLTSRAGNFVMELNGLGVPVPARPTTFDLVGGFGDAVDDYFAASGGRTDRGEMAQMAAAESLTALVGGRTQGLFTVGAKDVHAAVRELSTQLGFASLGHDFFARFTKRFLNYHLSRELSCHVGPASGSPTSTRTAGSWSSSTTRARRRPSSSETTRGPRTPRRGTRGASAW